MIDYRIVLKILLTFALFVLLSMPFAQKSFAADPPPTGSSTLDAINKFVNDTLNWKQGDPVPDTGSSTLNAIGQGILDALNYTPPGSSTGSGSSGGGGGAGGSWSSDPYNPSSSTTPSKDGACFNEMYGPSVTFPSPQADMQDGLKRCGDPSICSVSELVITGNKYSYRVVRQGSYNVVQKGSCGCPSGTAFGSSGKCVSICPTGSVYDTSSNTCKTDPSTCLSPNTFINGVCVPPKQPDPQTKTCPYGYTLTNGTCVKDPPKPCDPAVQQCNSDGTSKCDCCEKLDTIIGNQNIQISQLDSSNNTLAKMLAQQQTNNLKIDLLNSIMSEIKNQNQLSNTNLQLLQNQIGELIKLQKQGVQIDLKPIMQKLDEIKNNDNKNHVDLTALIAKALIDSPTQQPFLKIISDKLDNLKPASSTAPTVASATDLTEIMAKQDEQTGILKEIRDLFKDDKENPTPPPEVTPEEQESSLNNPLDGLRNYDISQNRFGGSAQCPNDRQFVALGATFTIGMSRFCDYLAMFGSVFLAMAYIAGGVIVVKGAGGN